MRVRMHPIHRPRLVFLVYIIIFMFFYRSASGDNEVICNRETHNGANYENSGMDYCNEKLHNPGEKETGTFTGLSEKVFKCCGLKAYNRLNEICCNFKIQPKSSPMADCCGKEAIDPKEELCCGANKKKLTKESPDHQCCFENQYNTKTQCCCPDKKEKVQSKSSDCCAKHTTSNKVKIHPNYSTSAPVGMRSHICGSSKYDPQKKCCCQRKHEGINLTCPSGQNPSPAVYDPKTEICCNGCLTRLKPWMDKCCGNTPYGLAQDGVLCCKNVLYNGTEDGEECSESGIPYKPFAETMCASKRHKTPGGHCCGEELYQPNRTICCKGQRYDRAEHIHCCGVQAYNISDPLKKCCEGNLYTLTKEDENDLQCCGSVLLNNQKVCCTSEDQSLLYPLREGFKCCGHLYYNPALWSCCAGKLSPVRHKTTYTSPTAIEAKLQLLNNLNKTQLCSEMFIGVVESVSRSSTVFNNVLKIEGEKAKVEPNVFILETLDQCKFLRLTTGKTYFFNHVDVFADFNHDSVLQSLHFILSKCSQ